MMGRWLLQNLQYNHQLQFQAASQTAASSQDQLRVQYDEIFIEKEQQILTLHTQLQKA